MLFLQLILLLFSSSTFPSISSNPCATSSTSPFKPIILSIQPSQGIMSSKLNCPISLEASFKSFLKLDPSSSSPLYFLPKEALQITSFVYNVIISLKFTTELQDFLILSTIKEASCSLTVRKD
ncbi:unnamed protein product [Amaranthus hypochondriacus]